MAKETSRWISDKTGENFGILHANIWLCPPHQKKILCQWVHLDQKDAFVISKLSLGSGGQSKVLAGVSIQGKPLAVLKNEDGRGYREEEISILKSLKESPHVIHLFDGNSDYLIEEYAPYCLFNLTKTPNQHPEFNHDEKHFSITRDILEGLADIHAKGIIHSDIKLENILLRKEGTALIADFGLSVKVASGQVHAGSFGYYAPEQMKSILSYLGESRTFYKLTTKVDIWQGMTALAHYHLPRLSSAYQERFHEYQEDLSRIFDEAMTEAEELANQASPDVQAKVLTRKQHELFARKLDQYFDEKRARRDGLFADLPVTSPLENILNQMGQFDPEKRPDAPDALGMLNATNAKNLTASL